MESDPAGRNGLALIWLVMKVLMDMESELQSKPPPMDMTSYGEERRHQMSRKRGPAHPMPASGQLQRLLPYAKELTEALPFPLCPPMM